MFKYFAFGLTCLCANSLSVNHQADAIDVQNLNQDQQSADAFFRSQVSSLEGATLANGQQDGKYFQYQYIASSAPLTLTEVSADRVDEQNNKFKLLEVTQSVSGPVEGGRLTSISKSYSTESLDSALDSLDWN